LAPAISISLPWPFNSLCFVWSSTRMAYFSERSLSPKSSPDSNFFPQIWQRWQWWVHLSEESQVNCRRIVGVNRRESHDKSVQRDSQIPDLTIDNDLPSGNLIWN
jgi:hypothetical protein